MILTKLSENKEAICLSRNVLIDQLVITFSNMQSLNCCCAILDFSLSFCQMLFICGEKFWSWSIYIILILAIALGQEEVIHFPLICFGMWTSMSMIHYNEEGDWFRKDKQWCYPCCQSSCGQESHFLTHFLILMFDLWLFVPRFSEGSE